MSTLTINSLDYVDKFIGQFMLFDITIERAVSFFLRIELTSYVPSLVTTYIRVEGESQRGVSMTTTRANGVENLPASIVIPANIAIISLDTWKADLNPSHYDCESKGKKNLESLYFHVRYLVEFNFLHCVSSHYNRSVLRNMQVTFIIN